MKTRILRCTSCGTYTLKESCPVCDSPTGPSAPARFSPEDPYGAQRRKLKKEQREQGASS